MGSPARVLLLSNGPCSPPLQALLQGCAVATDPGLLTTDRFDAVVADGTAESAADDTSPDGTATVERAVAGGTPLLLLVGATTPGEWCELAGVRPAGSEPFGEWFLKTAFTGNELTRRLPEEFAVADSLERLELSKDAVALLHVNIGFRDHAVAAERQVGHGRVVSVGLAGAGRGGFAPDVAQLLRRALVRQPEASRSFGLGILGYGPYGGMGLYHGLAARATDGLELVAACDADPGRLKAAEEEFPGLRTSVTADDLAADDDVKVVVVATPPVTHFALGLAMLRAGKHVVLEKPMCLTLAEADQLMAAAGEQGVALTVHQSRRFDADFVVVKRLVDSGELGEVFNVETFVGGFEHPCRAWHSEVEVSGGAVYDWGSHHLDWILQLMGGFPASLSAHGHKRVWRDVTNLDQVRVRLAWSDGREAEFVQSDVAGIRRPKFFVQGTKGTLAAWYRPLVFERLEPGVGYVGEHSHHAEAPVELSVALYEPGLGLRESRLRPARVDRYAFHRNLADHLQFGEPLAVTPESVRRVVALLEAAQRSTDSGNVTIPLPAI